MKQRRLSSILKRGEFSLVICNAIFGHKLGYITQLAGK